MSGCRRGYRYHIQSGVGVQFLCLIPLPWTYTRLPLWTYTLPPDLYHTPWAYTLPLDPHPAASLDLYLILRLKPHPQTYTIPSGPISYPKAYTLPPDLVDPLSLRFRLRYLSQIQIWTPAIVKSWLSYANGHQWFKYAGVQPGNAVKIQTICYCFHPGIFWWTPMI